MPSLMHDSVYYLAEALVAAAALAGDGCMRAQCLPRASSSASRMRPRAGLRCWHGAYTSRQQQLCRLLPVSGALQWPESPALTGGSS